MYQKGELAIPVEIEYKKRQARELPLFNTEKSAFGGSP